MMRARFREVFDAEKVFIIHRPLRLDGEDLVLGSEFPKTRVKLSRLRQLFDQRALGYPSETGADRAKPPNPMRPRLPDSCWQAGAEDCEPAPAPTWDVAIPDRWQYLPWNQMRSLATKFTSKPVNTKRDVFKVIQAEERLRASILEDYEAKVRAA